MKIMGAKVEQPVAWTLTTIVGLVGVPYALAGSPLGEVPDRFDALLWTCFIIVLIRTAALVALIVMDRQDAKENTR